MANINVKVIRAARHHGVPLMVRRQWGSKHALIYAYRRRFKKHSRLPKNPSDTLVQHITVTHDQGTTRVNFKEEMQQIERIGKDRFGTGFSYNYGWDMRTGMIGVGQPLDAKGSHTVNTKRVSGYSYDQNAVAIAIAAIGMPGDVPTTRAVDSLTKFIGILIVQGVLTPDFDYDPHSKFAAKDCPTDAVRKIMPEVRRKARLWARNH